MRKFIFLSLIFVLPSLANCTFVGKDFALYIEHSCQTLTCDKVLMQVYQSKEKALSVGKYEGVAKGNNLYNVEFKFQKGMNAYIIKNNELIITSYQKFIKALDLKPCVGEKALNNLLGAKF